MARHVDPSRRKEWRPDVGIRGLSIFYAVGACIVGPWLTWAAVAQGGWLWAPVLLAMAVIPSFVALRYAWRARVLVEHDSLVVFTTFSQRRFPWSEIIGAVPGKQGITLSLRNGERFLIGAVQKTNLATWFKLRSDADELAELIEARAAAAR